jgi:hypothetical protein
MRRTQECTVACRMFVSIKHDERICRTPQGCTIARENGRVNYPPLPSTLAGVFP